MMFGKKKLEQRIQELERQLKDEQSAHESDREKLREFEKGIELEKLALQEMQSAMRQKLQERDEKDRLYEIEAQEQRRRLAEDIAQETEKAHQELEQFRADQKALMQSRIRSLNEYYSFYLSQITHSFSRLNETTQRIGEGLLDQDAAVAELFQAQISSSMEDVVRVEDSREDAVPPFAQQEEPAK